MVRLVVRVLDADNRLLAWAPVPAEMRGDGCLWVTGVHPAPVEAVGVPAWISVHWPDLNVQVRTRLPSVSSVAPGQTIPLAWPQPVIRFPSDPTPMPGVTVRGPVGIAPPTGNLQSAAGVQT